MPTQARRALPTTPAAPTRKAPGARAKPGARAPNPKYRVETAGGKTTTVVAKGQQAAAKSGARKMYRKKGASVKFDGKSSAEYGGGNNYLVREKGSTIGGVHVDKVSNPAPKPAAEENPRRRRRGRKGRRRNPKRKSNPVGSVLGILAIGAAATTVGYFGYRAYARRRALNKPLAQSLEGVLSPGAILASVPFIVDDVQQPIALSSVSPPPSGYALVPDLIVHAPGSNSAPTPIALRNVEFGSGESGVPNDGMWAGRTLDGTAVTGIGAGEGVPKAISALVIGVTPEFARQAYERVLAKVATGAKWDSDHDTVIAQVLKILAPGVDWSQGLAPYARGDAASQAWGAVQLLGAVANQNYYNKQALAGA